MGRKIKYSKELKLEIVRRYLKGESALLLANEYGMPKSMAESIRKWARRFEAMGEGGFDYSKTNNSYSKDLKEKIINEYLSGQLNSYELSYKYKISKSSLSTILLVCENQQFFTLLLSIKYLLLIDFIEIPF